MKKIKFLNILVLVLVIFAGSFSFSTFRDENLVVFAGASVPAQAPTTTGSWKDVVTTSMDEMEEEEFDDLFNFVKNNGGDGEDVPYLIKTAEELAYFSYAVNTNGVIADILTAKVELDEDIVIDIGKFDGIGKIWTPIGLSNRIFAGSFDGKGATIKNLTITNGEDNSALFAYFNGTAKNVILESAYVVASTIAGNVAAFCGEASATSTFSNIWVTSSETVLSYVEGYFKVGGIVATGGKSFDNCINYATVKSTSTANNSNTYYTAGIVAYNSTSEIFYMNECENYGEIIGASFTAGLSNLDSQMKPTIESSKNAGNVSGLAYVSGLINMVKLYSDNKVVLTGCENSGNIKATANYVAGVIYAYDNLVILTNCTNTGSIDAKTSSYVAGIVVSSGSTTTEVSVIKDCQTLSKDLEGSTTIEAVSYVAGICVTGAKSAGTEFISCTNEAYITASDNTAAGITTGANTTSSIMSDLKFDECKNYGTITNSNNYTGGIVARIKSVNTFTSCENHGDIIGLYDSAQHIGGFVGEMIANNKFYSCTNSGNILQEGKECIGGFVGNIGTGATGNLFEDCTNEGIINTTGINIGGFVGKLLGDITFNGCENTYNGEDLDTGSILSRNTTTYVNIGGFIGYSLSQGIVTFNDCTNNANIGSETTYKAIGGFIGQTTTYGGTYYFDKCFNNGEIKGLVGVAGFVGNIYGSYAHIQQIFITNSVNTGDIYGWDGVAGFTGYAHFVHLKNCSNTGDIQEYDGVNPIGYAYYGGLVGKGHVEVIDCFNTGHIYNVTSSKDYATGGLVGYALSSSVHKISMFIRSYNTGNVSGITFVGGIFGTTNGYNVYVSECYNSGNIYGKGERVGGIAGAMYVNAEGASFIYEETDASGNTIATYNATNQSVIINSYNTGNVTALTRYCGGLVGYLCFQNSVNALNDTIITIDHSYSSATITCAGAGTGGIIGYIVYGGSNTKLQTLNLNYVYYEGSSLNIYGSRTSYSEGKTFYNIVQSDSLTYSEMRTASDFIGWDFSASSIWTIWVNESVNEGRPFLKTLSNEKPATISFDSTGGTLISIIITDTIGNFVNISHIADPERIGYTFKHWITVDGIVITDKENVELIWEDMVLYAVWTPIQYTIIKAGDNSFKIYDGSGSEQSYITMGENFRFEAAATTIIDENRELTFAGWKIWNYEENRWDNILGNNILYLISLVNEDFILNYTSSENITIQAIYSVSYLVTFNVLNSEYATILINGSQFVISNNKILFSEDASEIRLTITPIEHYTVKRILVDGIQTELLVFDASNITSISIEIEATTYFIKIEAIDSDSKEIDNPAALFDGYKDEFEIQIGDSFIDKIRVIMPSDEFRFLGYSLFNKQTFKDQAYSSLDGSFNVNLIDEDFLSKYLNTYTGEIVITAAFIEQFYVYIDTPFEMKDRGTLIIVLETQGQTYSPISVDGYFDKNTKISVRSVGKSTYSPAGFYINDVYFDLVEDIDLKSDMEIIANFKVTTYSILFKVVDSYNTVIPGEEIGFKVLKDGESDPIVSDGKGLSINDRIVNISRNDLDDYDYEFTGWFYVLDGEPVRFTLYGTDIPDKQIVINSSLIRDWGSNNQVIIYARYIKLYELTLNQNESGSSSFTLEKSTNGIDYSSDGIDYNNLKFTIETKIRIIVDPSDYFDFKRFEGINYSEQTTNKLIAEIYMIGTRNITLEFEAIPFDIIDSANLNNAKGSLIIEQDSLKCGDVIVLTFNVKSGYQISSWTINGDNVKTLSNAKLNGNIVLLTITEDWLIDNWTADGIKLNSVVKTTMNQSYLAILLTAGIGIPTLLAVAIVLFTINRKRNIKIKAMISESKRAEIRLNEANYIESLRKGNAKAVGEVSKKDIKNYKKKDKDKK